MSKTTAIRKWIIERNITNFLGHKNWESEQLKSFGQQDVVPYSEKVVVHCLIHDFYTEKRVRSLKTGNHPTLCPFCQNKRCNGVPVSLVKQTALDKGYELISIDGQDSFVDSTLIKAKTPIYCKCPKHGQFKTTYDSLRSGRGCFACGHDIVGQKSHLSEDVIVDRLNKNNCDLEKVEYINGSGLVYYRCRIHSNIVQKTFLSNLMHGYGCPLCSSSKGEREVRQALKKNNINFEEQKTFENCSFKKKLRFDFYLPDFNACIEYQGKQHYFPPYQWGNKILSQEEAYEEFELIQKRDNIKREFCQENNIKLIEISYKDYKRIEEILQKELVNESD